MIFALDSRVIVQGIVEPIGQTYVPLIQAYGTQVIAGVSPGWGGEQCGNIPIFDMVEQVVARMGAIDISLICTHPYEVLDAATEAMRAGVRQLVLISQGVPPLDMIHLIQLAESTETLLVGPNGPGVIVPGKLLLGIHPPMFYMPGRVGLLTRNGPLTYDVARTLTKAGIGQSIGVSIGSDAIVGSTFQQWLQILEEDEDTDAIVLVGEIGGDSEELAASYIAESIDKPVIAYIAGHTAPRDRRMGHAGTIIESKDAKVGDFRADLGTAESKVTALKQAGVPVADRPSQLPDLVSRVLKPKRSTSTRPTAASARSTAASTRSITEKARA
jgi:succinyl-CoA synthetase alpha subunit